MTETIKYRRLPDDPCLTRDQLLAYKEGKLSRAEMHACEKHMLDCDLCSDALDGFMLMKDVRSVPGANSDDLNDEKGKVIPISSSHKKMWYAAAAILVLVLSSTFFIRTLSEQKSELAMVQMDSVVHEEEVISAAPQTVNDSVSESTKKDQQFKTVTEQIITKNEAVSQTEEAPAPVAATSVPSEDLNDAVVFSDNFESTVSGDADDATSTLQESVADKSSQEEKNQSKDKKSFLDKQKFDLGLPSRAEKAASAPSSKGAFVTGKENESNSVAAGNTAPSASNQPVTLQDTTTKPGAPHPLKPSDKDLELSYLNGVNLLNSGQPATAIVFFDEVLKNKYHARYYDARWQKANALIKVGKKEEAKTLLNTIISEGGLYKTEAQELLKTL